jgi:hypothetical protein
MESCLGLTQARREAAGKLSVAFALSNDSQKQTAFLKSFGIFFYKFI